MWLVVHGTGQWGFADGTRRIRNFEAGAHDIGDDQEALNFIRRAPAFGTTLTLHADEPLIARRTPQGSAAQSLRERLDDVHTVIESEPGVPLEPDDPGSPLGDFPCSCGARYPHPAARARHWELSCPDRAA